MSGHSKWSTIKHTKGLKDAARSASFTKLAREITMSAKLGDPNPENNARLRLAIFNARKASMPGDNIKRAIEKSQASGGENYDSVRYEGYGPGAIPMIVEAMTDNPRRTAPEIKNLFAKGGGNIGEMGSVAFMFKQKGVIYYPLSAAKNADEMMEIIMEVGAEDLDSGEDCHVVYAKAEAFGAVQKALSDKLGEPEEAGIEWIPDNPVEPSPEDAAKLEKLVNILNENDDVQKVFTAMA
ncbi:MAG: YebC/PmpR family DNA-binding transcriptional regulator [Rickettsiales bacterium]|jgi:YebC/PmpR family DNA-binding regulatory protein|nr:YebC/PmpR family DNA-binding transcriptional regulator [Rickettsiales bacterium]